MTTHARFESLSARAIDFELSASEQSELDRHLASCRVCRSVAAGYRADAAALRAFAFLEPPAWVRSAVLSAAARRKTRSIDYWKVLAAAAVLLAALIGAAFTIGAFDRRPNLVDVLPTDSPSASHQPSVEPAAYTPPSPACPAPATVPSIPDVTVSVGTAPGQTATLWGAGLTTCSSTGTDDGVPSEPAALLSADPGNRFALMLPSGWSFLDAEATDRATSSNAIARVPIEPTDRPARIELPVTAEPGESIVGFDLWIISTDERVVARLSIGIRVHVSGTTPTDGPSSGTVAALTVPAGAITSMGTKDLWSATADGSRAVELVLGAKARTGGTLTLHDLSTGSSTNLASLDATHSLTSMATSGDRLVWVETWRDNPSPPSQDVPNCSDVGKPLRWRISALTLSTGTTSTIATGTNHRSAYLGQCADVGSPAIAIDGDRLAYTTEATSTGQPLADRIVLRDLATGSEVKSLTTDGAVEDLHVSGEIVAYRENLDTSQGGLLVFGTGRLMVVQAAQKTADVIVDKVGAIALGGGHLAWIAADGALGNVWTSNTDGTVATEIAAPAHDGLTLTGTSHLSASDGLIAWSVVATIDAYSGGPNGCCASMLAVWAPGKPSARFIEGYGTPDAVTVGSGWLVWHTNRYSLTWHDDGTTPDGFHAVRLDALASPWR